MMGVMQGGIQVRLWRVTEEVVVVTVTEFRVVEMGQGRVCAGVVR